MATNHENNELVDSKPADISQSESESKISQVENSVENSKPNHDESEPMDAEMANPEPAVEQVDSQTEGEKLASENVISEVANTEPLSNDTVHSTPTSLDDARIQSINSEHVGKEHLNSQLVNSKALQTEPDNTELTHSQPEASSVDVVHSEPLNPTEENNEAPSLEQTEQQPIQSEYSISQTKPSLMVKSERAEPVPMDMDEPNTQNTAEHEITELAHPEPLGEEVEYTPPVTSEQIHSQPLTSDAINTQNATEHEELAHPEPLGEEVEYAPPVTSEQIHSQPLTSDAINTQNTAEHEMTELAHPEPLGEEVEYTPPITSEQIHSQPLTSDAINTQAVSAELVHSHPVTAEMVDAQLVTATIAYSQPLSSEIVHSQPVSSELVNFHHSNLDSLHLQPLGVELVNSHDHGSEVAVGMELVTTEPLSTEIVNTQPLSTEIVNTQQATPETQPGKRRKKKSIVWEHFTIETVSAGCRRAYCKVCKQSFAYSTGSKVAGTSHLKRHIAKGTCPVVLRQQEKNQLSPYMPKSGGTDPGTERPPKRRYRTSSAPYLIFDQDRCRQEIARMIIMHEYPLHMVEHPGFVSFVQNLQPRFDMVSFNIVQGDCVAIFLREKQNLQRFIEGIPGRICLTVDLWTSSQSTGYVFVSGQFIDNDWKLHRRLLNVVMEPFPESDRALSHAIGTCLSDWGLDRKLASITFNQQLGENALDQLRALLAVKNPMLLKGQLLIRSCIARTLSSMAQEVISAAGQTIKKIRTSVKYVKTSESHEEKFVELKQQLQVPTEKSLSLDNITKWNTTYEMLLAASELKQVFSCLDTCDSDYKDAPSMDDWKEVDNILMYLKLLYDTANLLLSNPTPSSNVFFHEVWKIQLELARASASDDLFVAGLAKPLQDKFHKYWKNSCLVLAVSVAMDPRFKMKLVEFSFTKIFMDEAPVYIRIVDEGIHELFHEYMTLPLPSTSLENNNGASVKRENPQGGDLLNNNGLSDFDMYIMETSSQQMKSELDQYLEESLLPRVQDFDVLGWWKLNKLKYPTLSKMARDILSVPLSTVNPDAVFDISTKEMDSYRCSLRPETLEALICAKDWLQPDSSKTSKELVKMEL